MTTEVRWKPIYTCHHRQKETARQRAAALNEQACAGSVDGNPRAEWRVRVLLDGVALESRPVPYDLPFETSSICTSGDIQRPGVSSVSLQAKLQVG